MVAAKEATSGDAENAVAHADAALAETEASDGKDSWAYGNAVLNASEAAFHRRRLRRRRKTGGARRNACRRLPRPEYLDYRGDDHQPRGRR